MQKNTQHKSTFAILGVFLLLFFSIYISLFVSSVVATTNVSIENSGSRLNAKADSTPASYQWLRADAIDGTYSPIEDATQKYYDITAADEGKYIKVIIDGSESEATGPIGKLITMDIGQGAITLGATYSGKDSEGNVVSGSHLATNIYVITHKENGQKTTNNIVFDGHHENAPFNVTLDNVNMGATPTNHNQAPGNSGVNTPTGGQITIKALQTTIKKVTLVLKGENQVRNITYYNAGDTSTPQTVDSYLKITDINGDGAVGDGIDGGSLYIPYKIETEAEIEAFVATKTNYNHWNAGIGGIDSQSLVQNLHIAGGKIQVVTTLGDNCTAIGAGGNGYCEMLISGGEVIAHCNGTGAAIGGGIGWNAAGGKSNVTITGGKIYAKNHSEIKSGDELVGGVAIGSGSSFHAAGSEGIVTITGGYVEAYGTFGNGIGGGNSSTSTGGKATINITGGTVIASSIGGGDSKSGAGGSASVTVSGSADITLTKGIGGGKSSSGNGGAATITVEGGTINVAGSIGGGEGGGTGNGGDATVNIFGGNLTAASIGGGTGSVGGHGGAAIVKVTDGFIETGSIGGGKTNNPNGNLGYAKATIEGGDIRGQFLMAAGGTEPCTFTMSGGTLHGVNTAGTSEFNYAQQNGAAVYMDDPTGTVNISGGTIKDCSAQNGGAIYMTAGKCTVSGDAVIQNCSSLENGGAIYLGGGTMTVSGGTIKENTAETNGGAVYLGGGTMNVSEGEISANYAKDSGGGAYINGGNVYVSGGSVSNNIASNNGGGIAVNNGNYKMTGGSVDGNKAENAAGGGIYVSADGNNVTVDVLSGSVSSNSSKGNGGALAVVGDINGTEQITVTVGVKELHFDSEGKKIDCTHGAEDALECPVLNANSSAASGGAIYVTGNTSTVLNLFCLEESNSTAVGDNGQSNFMKVDGGKVTITTSEKYDENEQTANHGNTHIGNTVYVTGGQMDIWGKMTNPRLEDIVTVDITKEGDYFDDHRYSDADETYYKLLYYENFKDPVTGVITGQYKELEIKHGTEVTISGNIYSHPGYNIKGWNTGDGYKTELDDFSQKDKPTQSKGWYDVGKDYLFDGEPIGDLTIYAIWEPNGYTVIYDPNVPAGEKYTGTMANSNFTYDKAENLPENKFERIGYEFIGWSKNPEGPKEYDNNQAVTNLTTKKGEVVTLYAQWIKCNHDPSTHEYTYSVVDNGQTLKRECFCKGYSEEVRLSAENVVYDMLTHPADVVYTSETWKPEVIHEALDDGDVLVECLPYHAGNYKASVTENGYTASVTYTIEKAEQPAPPKPVFDTDTQTDGSVLSVYPVAKSAITDSEYKSVPQYRIVYYVDEEEIVTDWVEGADSNALIDGKYAVQFTLDKALTNYYIQARYSECDNYKASPESTADSVYFFDGNVKLIVDSGEHIRYTVVRADGEDETINDITISIYTEDGYFFQTGYKASIKTENAENNAQASLSPADAFSTVYEIKNIPKNCVITLTLPDTQKALEITSNITEKQVFGIVTSNTAVISRDSAFTASFDVNNYSTEEYESLKLSFGTALPADATVIMVDRNNNDFYWLSASGKSEIVLTEFVRMGTAGDDFELRNGDIDLQFVVDFSKTSDGMTGESIIAMLFADKKAASRAESVESSEAAELRNANAYSLQIPSDSKGQLVYNCTESGGIASKWDNRDNAFVFTPKKELPEDAHLKIVQGESTISIYANANGDFVYQSSRDNEGMIYVELISNLLDGENVEYDFDVKWMSAYSIADTSPTNGTLLGKTEITVIGAGSSGVSLKISGDKKLYSENETVSAYVLWNDLPLNYSLEVVLMVKSDNGEYSSTAVTQKIEFNATDGTLLIQVPLAGNKAGSYRLQLVAEVGLVTVAEAEYYFIIE